MSTPIDFVALAAALLDRAPALVAQWLPQGIERNCRWYVGDFDGSPGESANVNLQTGQWIDNAAPDEDKGGDLISLYARIRGLNNGQAARELMRDLGWERQQASAQPAGINAAGPDRPEPPAPEGDATPAAKPARREQRWKPVVPVPAHAPKPEFRFGFKNSKTGDWLTLDAVRTWAYEFEGALYGHVARFERIASDGTLVKDTVPLTWCTDSSDGRGLQRWHWKSWDAPRPLYVPATLLAGDPSTIPVVVVEGEKCAEAGHQLLGHEFDFVSWPGGCKTWAMAHWGWLMGRTVYLWPDCDAQRSRLTKEEREAGVDPKTKRLLPEAKQPGMQAMVNIGSLLVADQGCTVLMCGIPAPGAKPDGWDIADAIAEGWDAAKVRDFIRAATPFVAPDDAARAKAGSAQPSAGASVATEEGGDDEPNVKWRKHLLTTAQGAIGAARENVALALDGWPERGIPGIAEAAGVLAFNEFTNNVEKTRDTPWGTPAGAWLECDELLMGQWLVRDHWLPSMPRTTLEEAVLMVAQRHAFHPVRQRVEAMRGKHDGLPRLKTWLRRCCLEEDEYDARDPLQRYLARAGKWFIMAMVARVLPQVKEGPRIVRGPGTKFDYMLIFESPQGWGKSTLAAVLGGEHFADTGLMIGDKDSYQNIQGILVYEWGELENLSRQEVTKVKLFISSPKDRFRASFDRRPRDYPRQVVFVGTTNEATYLTDVTGNRRFWPVRLTRPPDNDWLRANLDQLIAEAIDCLDAGDRFWPTREEQRLLFDPQQQARTVESSLESSIRRFLYDEDQHVPPMKRNGAHVDEIGMVEILERVGFTIDKQSDAVVKKAGQLLNSLGWSIRRTSLPGRPRVYVRPKDRTEADAGDAGASPSSTRPPQGASAGEVEDDFPF